MVVVVYAVVVVRYVVVAVSYVVVVAVYVVAVVQLFSMFLDGARCFSQLCMNRTYRHTHTYKHTHTHDEHLCRSRVSSDTTPSTESKFLVLWWSTSQPQKVQQTYFEQC